MKIAVHSWLLPAVRSRGSGTVAGLRKLALISTLAFLAVLLAPAGKLRGASAVPLAGLSTPAASSAAATAEAVPGDDALRSYLGQSELVVAGEFLFLNEGGANLGPFQVASTIKGEPQTYILVHDDRGWPGPNIEYPEGEMVLFLYRREARGTTNLEPFWRPRDLKFGAIPATPALVASLKRLAAVLSASAGEEQLGALMRRWLPNSTLRELKYTIGDKSYSTAVLTGSGTELDRREMKWVVGYSTGRQKTLTSLLSCTARNSWVRCGNDRTSRRRGMRKIMSS